MKSFQYRSLHHRLVNASLAHCTQTLEASSVFTLNNASTRHFSRNGSSVRRQRRSTNITASHIPEDAQAAFKKILHDWKQDDNEDELKLPKGLTAEERKYIHGLAWRNNLKSKSRGKGKKRYLTLLKDGKFWKERVLMTDGSRDKEDLDEFLPVLRLPAEASSTLKKYLKQFPPTAVDGTETPSISQEYFMDSPVEISGRTHNRLPNKVKGISRREMKKRSKWYHDSQRTKVRHPNYSKMEKTRAKLPAYKYRKEICDVVRNNRVTLLTGDTGCGKSTQVPQFLLDDPEIGPQCNIVVTQPRRISAMSIAERVASERCEPLGESVGYTVRLESAGCEKTQVRFVTPGILLRKFQSDPSLADFTHIIIDEIHERDKNTEFFMIALQKLLDRRNDLHVVLMSATLQTEELLNFWRGVRSDEVPTMIEQKENFNPAEISIPGRTFPVQSYFLEDILAMTKYVDDVETMSQSSPTNDTNYFNIEGMEHVTYESDSGETLRCFLCGRADFNSPAELGLHITLCDGEKKDIDILTNESDHLFTSSDPVCDLDEESVLSDKELLDRYNTIHDDEMIDLNLILETLKHVEKSSKNDEAILVFLPGWQEISKLTRLLENSYPFNDILRFRVLPLHSGIPSRNQKLVFQKTRKSVRKIILATNIAETSVTIDDVGYVIDTGKAKEKNYDPHIHSNTLLPMWISKASVKQRKGRSGRTRPGVCYHLYSREQYASFRPFLESELLRSSLEEICLQCKKLNLAPGREKDADGIPAFFEQAMSPPHPKSVGNALDLLVNLGAMEAETNNLTDLGNCLSMLSCEPRVGKMVIWSYIIGCAKESSSMAVSMSYKSPFIIPPETMKREADSLRVAISDGSESDKITVLKLLDKRDLCHDHGAHDIFRSFCRKNYVNHNTLEMIAEMRGIIARELTSIGFPDPNLGNSWHNRNSTDSSLAFLQATIAAGLYPNIASRKRGDTTFRTMTSNQQSKIHLSSINAMKGQPLNSKSKVGEQDLEFLVYGELMRGAKTFTMDQTSYIGSPLPFLLFCGDFRIRPLHGKGGRNRNMAVMLVDNLVKISCDQEDASALTLLRSRLKVIFQKIVANPSQGLDALNEAEIVTLDVLQDIIQSSFNSAARR